MCTYRNGRLGNSTVLPPFHHLGRDNMPVVMPVGAFIAAFVILLPIPWLWRARNTSMLSLIAWLFVLNTIYGINAVIWNGNAIPLERFHTWCDISECPA